MQTAPEHWTRRERERARKAGALALADCAMCRLRFESKWGALYCSSNCKHKAKVLRRARTCEFCGGEFRSPYHQTKTCSQECGKKLSERTRATNYMPPPAPNQAQKRREWLRPCLGLNSHNRAAYVRAVKNDPCAYCGRPARTGPRTELDHIEPVPEGIAGKMRPSDYSAQNSLWWDNMTAACQTCNWVKGRKSLLEFLAWPTGWLR